MKIKPCEDWVYFEAKIIRKIGLLELPETAQKQEEDVTVLDIGPDVKGIKKGDNIIICPESVVRHKMGEKLDESAYGFVREGKIIAKIDK